MIINPGTLWKIFQCTVIQSSWNFQFSKNIFQSDKTASLLWRFILQRGNRSLICFIQIFIGGWGHGHQITNQVYINILWIAYSILAINYSFWIWIVLCILYLYQFIESLIFISKEIIGLKMANTMMIQLF